MNADVAVVTEETRRLQQSAQRSAEEKSRRERQLHEMSESFGNLRALLERQRKQTQERDKLAAQLAAQHQLRINAAPLAAADIRGVIGQLAALVQAAKHRATQVKARPHSCCFVVSFLFFSFVVSFRHCFVFAASSQRYSLSVLFFCSSASLRVIVLFLLT
jgi:hypothetical protein